MNKDEIKIARDTDKAGFITKASAQYCNIFPLRAAIQAIPTLGSSLDTMLAGLGAKYQYKRLEDFIEELREILKKLTQNNNAISMRPSEELFDLMMQVFDRVVKTRSKEKRKRFANIIVNQVVIQHDWDEAETAMHLLSDLTELHIKMLEVALNAPFCDGVFEGLRVVMFSDYRTSGPKHLLAKPPTNISSHFKGLSPSVIQMVCSELIAKGLFYDESVGRFGGPKAMSFLRATEFAQWFINWITAPSTENKVDK